MQSTTFKKFDPSRVPSPCFVVDEAAIENNLKTLHHVQEQSGAKILAALKAFSLWRLSPLISSYLSGICASGLHEARLGREEFGGEVHVYSAAYKEQDFSEIYSLADHIIFNSFSQWEKYKPQTINPMRQFGLRINPEHSEGTTPIYDPCAEGSRLGIPVAEFMDKDLSGISGLHFHTLCEQGLEPLRRTLIAMEEKFANYLPQMQWINLGGGHHITHPDYDVEGLIELLRGFADRYQVQVYLEPGEAVAIRSGVLVSEILDITHTDRHQVILDTSATCHMPDTLEMPYRADIFNAGLAGEKKYTYRLGGLSCLAGDVMGDYSFDGPLVIGDRLIFDDMAHYTMVKTTTFNGVALPSIALWNSRTDELNVIRKFEYIDFKQRLS